MFRVTLILLMGRLGKVEGQSLSDWYSGSGSLGLNLQLVSTVSDCKLHVIMSSSVGHGSGCGDVISARSPGHHQSRRRCVVTPDRRWTLQMCNTLSATASKTCWISVFLFSVLAWGMKDLGECCCNRPTAHLQFRTRWHNISGTRLSCVWSRDSNEGYSKVRNHGEGPY